MKTEKDGVHTCEKLCSSTLPQSADHQILEN